MRRNRRKRVFAAILIAVLIGNSLTPGGKVIQVSAQESTYGESQDTVSGNSTEYEVIHIGQTTEQEEIYHAADAEDSYDMPIALSPGAEIYLFASFLTGDESGKAFEGKLTWSILRGEAGMMPGTTNLVNEEDDWIAFEEVSSSPYFTFQEETEENSYLYKTVTLTAGDPVVDDHYDYYIRASFWDEEKEYCAITTLSVNVAEMLEEEEAAITEKSDEQTIPETEEGADIAEAEDEEALLETEEAEIPETEDEEALLEAEEAEIPEAEEEEALLETEEAEIPETEDEEALLEAEEAEIPGAEEEEAETTEAEERQTILEMEETSEITETEEETVITENDGGTVSGQEILTDMQTGLETEEQAEEESDSEAVSDEIWIEGFERESDALTYTGGKITQNLRIYHKETLLKENTDYVLTYKNNVNAAEYDSLNAPSVTITMKGQYSGGRTLYFTIAPRDIDENQTLGYEQVLYYSKKLQIPAPAIYYGSKKLVMNKDFVCDYSSLPENYTQGDAYEEGTLYEYTVKGKGNFTGSFTMKLAVLKNQKLDFGKAVVTLDKKQYAYHGEALSASEVLVTSVKIGKTVLSPELYEYEVIADGVGTGTVRVYPSETGRNSGYRGVKTVTFKVVGDRKIGEAKTGEAWQDTVLYSKEKLDQSGRICQEKTGVLVFSEEGNETVLKEGVDYTVKYSNNRKVGKATVVFTGKGRYTGTLKKTFKIIPNTELSVTWKDLDETGMPVTVYQKGGAIPEFELTEASGGESSCVLNSKTDYTVKVKNNQKPGIMTCEIIGKGNYKGYRSITEVKVISADISRGTITVQDRKYQKKANAWKSTVTITDVNGKKLKAGTDYDKKLIYSYDGIEEGQLPPVGTVVYVTALGINNYEGTSITGSYRIYKTSLSDLVIVIDKQEYTGKYIELSADDIHVYAGKKELKKGQEITDPCYQIVTYKNNTKVGTAKVILRGTGNYGGTRTCSFKITRKKYITTRVSSITLDETSISIGVGNSRQLTASITPEDAWNKTVVWTTSDSKIAAVTKDGIVTAVKPGTVTIKAVAQDTGKKASCKVTVSVIPVTSFSLNIAELHQKEGTRYQLTTTDVQPAEATYSTIKWESTYPEIASVDENGMVTLHKAGMAVIKAYVTETQFVSKCLVFVESAEEETLPEETYLTPQMFRTAGEDDDTKAFNEAIRNLGEDSTTLYVPAGTYKINAETGIRLKSNMKLIMSSQAVLQAADTSGKYYNVIYANHISNVTISGGQVKGERYGHSGTSGEWGMGIGIYDSTDICIDGVSISDCWGDGIYLGSNHEEDSIAGCSGVTITNCNVFNNRRNNLSIVMADYVTVSGCSFQDANGTAPEFGIDIETNNSNNPCEHIVISHSTFSGNGKGSMGIITTADDIRISDCTLNGDFVNYDGTNVVISGSVIRGEMNARIGVSLVDGTVINDGGSEEDVLVASYRAAEDVVTIGEYAIDDANPMLCSVIEDEESPSGKVLYFKRTSEGTRKAGYYLSLSELMEDASSALEKGAVYRFEYVVKGTGVWGIKTDQTGWYPCVPMADQFSTGIVTYQDRQRTANCIYMQLVRPKICI